jgi:hypothetical protein
MEGLCGSGFSPHGTRHETPWVSPDDANQNVKCSLVGLPHLINTHLLITGCARGVENALVLSSMATINSLLDKQPSHAALIFADGSHLDRTYNLLRSWSSRNPQVRAILTAPGADLPTRLQRLTTCRNTLLGFSLSQLGPGATLAMLDLDCRLVSPEAVLAALPHLESRRFDVLTANSEPYRDLWALRSTRLGVDYDCWQIQGGRHEQAMKPECRRYRISLNERAAPFAVDSAFNGLSIMSVDALRRANAERCRYPMPEAIGVAAVRPGGEGHICEHVSLSSCLTSHGLRLGILPSMLVNCTCGAVCSPAQRYWFRVRLEADGMVRVKDRRTRRPMPPSHWRRFTSAMCGGEHLVRHASDGNRSVVCMPPT